MFEGNSCPPNCNTFYRTSPLIHNIFCSYVLKAGIVKGKASISLLIHVGQCWSQRRHNSTISRIQSLVLVSVRMRRVPAFSTTFVRLSCGRIGELRHPPQYASLGIPSCSHHSFGLTTRQNNAKQDDTRVTLSLTQPPFTRIIVTTAASAAAAVVDK